MKAAADRAIVQAYDALTRRGIFERIEELNRTQWLSGGALVELQRQKLQRMVEYAYQYVPYYRRAFDAAGFHPGDLRLTPESLIKFPF